MATVLNELNKLKKEELIDIVKEVYKICNIEVPDNLYEEPENIEDAVLAGSNEIKFLITTIIEGHVQQNLYGDMDVDYADLY